ncbi:glycerophosphodiester phosphodiesterase family protein [Krasilnikoviella flava]|uniref:Glycerophosphoryl diester phosphodiesterase n=1 Tax=Krasilnikoviella flava TaxID=526729 RepID=A0A1T5IR19_9MICO|nr:glycerophosphodiester phosphodiesterase family protein [Krasilnikoviella flava]SKC41591.1 glycerophosphoryl diester phosphodiesterase [Krasilnikoviella flava]
MPSTRLRRTATSALAVALTAAAAVGGTTAVTHGTDAASTAETTAETRVTTTPASSPALAFGGKGHGGRTDAERAYRDLLDHDDDAKILTAAHRGQWRDAPENSLPAIEAAFDDGAEIVELDVRLTSDGVPVLMHDETVDRTTDGSGAVSSFTLAEIRELRLKEHLGGAQTALTDERVPTLAEAMEVAADRGLVNLDKGWPAREEIWDVLADTGTVRNGLFKSDAPVAEVEAFREAHPGALYLHMISDANLASFDEFGDDQPVGYEVVFGTEQDAVARAPFLERLAGGSRVWINSMWNGLADHLTDEASLIDPSRGWESLVTTFRASMIQTDDVVALERWLRTGEGDRAPRGSVRVQAEDFAPGGEGVAYHDVDAGNRGGLDMRPGEDVDISDADGNVRVSWLRGGEWLTYEVDVPRTGRYELSARVSSPYTPAGAYTVSFDGGTESERVAVLSTTSHNKQELQASGVVQRLTKGTHTVRVSLPDDAYQNWNLDYLQFDPVSR